jgi:hypothetical protein
MKIAARGYGKLAVCLDSFDEVFRENQANWQFAIPCSDSTLSILILKSNRQIELCFQRLGNM